MRRAVEPIKTEPEMASIRTINLAVLAARSRKLAANLITRPSLRRAKTSPDWAAELEATCEAHVSDRPLRPVALSALRQRLESLRDRARAIAFEMDFSFLLRPDRKLLSIGYRVEEHQLDESCYDLLASEARLTSLFAIAKGDMPTEHWFRLGRPIVEIGFARGADVVVGLDVRVSDAAAGDEGAAGRSAQPDQPPDHPPADPIRALASRSRGASRKPAYNARDREMTYQYTNFGVPGLGLKRGLGENAVDRALCHAAGRAVHPHGACENLRRLRLIGALGRYGFHDAVDFTPSRVPEGNNRAVVYNYMAHHQGMSIVAIANAVLRGPHARPLPQRSGDRIGRAAAAGKGAARHAGLRRQAEATERVKVDAIEVSPDARAILNPSRRCAPTNLMSNGHYSVMLTATGSGYSRWNELAVTRWQPDPSEDRMGNYLFLSDVDSGEWWSATAEPKRAADETAARPASATTRRHS